MTTAKKRLQEIVNRSTKPIHHINDGDAVANSSAIAEYFDLPHDTLLHIYALAQERAETYPELQKFYRANMKKPLFGNGYELTRDAFIHFSEPPQYGGYPIEKRSEFIALYEKFTANIIIPKSNIIKIPDHLLVDQAIDEQYDIELTPLTQQQVVLIAEINICNQQTEQAWGNLLVCAARTGAKLCELEKTVKYGEWLPLLAKHCTVSRQYATKYMRLAEAYPQLLDLNVNTPLHSLDISRAYLLRNASDDVKNEVYAEIEQGNDVSQKRIKQMIEMEKQFNDARDVVMKRDKEIEELNEELAETNEQLIQAEHQTENLQNELTEKELELEGLIKEGGVNELVEQKTAELSTKIDELTAQIAQSQQQSDDIVKTKVAIELAKKDKELKGLDTQIDSKKSELETIDSKLKQSQTNAAYNERHQQIALKLIETLSSAKLTIKTTTPPENAIFDYKTMKMLAEVENECCEFLGFIVDLAIYKQTEIETQLENVVIDIEADEQHGFSDLTLDAMKTQITEPECFYYLTENGTAGYRTVTAKWNNFTGKMGFKNFKAAAKKANNAIVTAYRSTDDVKVGDALENVQNRWCFTTNDWIK